MRVIIVAQEMVTQDHFAIVISRLKTILTLTLMIWEVTGDNSRSSIKQDKVGHMHSHSGTMSLSLSSLLTMILIKVLTATNLE